MSGSFHFWFFVFFDQNDQKRKNQLYCLHLKRTADFVVKTDEKRKTKDEMNPANTLQNLENFETQEILMKLTDLDILLLLVYA